MLDFPNSPTTGQKFPSPAVPGVPTYTWDGQKWTTAGLPLAGKTPVYIDGSTAMTAALTLVAPPVHPTDAAAKSYVDGAVRFDSAQALSAGQTAQARENIAASGVVRTTVFTSSGTWTPNANMLSATIECIGGGGSGGGAAGSSTGVAVGGGGHSGGYSKSSAAAGTTAQTVTIGAGGTPGAAGNNAGGAGGSTSVGSLCIANGGPGGSPAPGSVSAVAAAGTGNIVAFPGFAGQGSINATVTTGNPQMGGGAPSFFGGAVQSRTGSAQGAGLAAAANTGAGGSGAGFNSTAGNAAGGAGGSGVVIITEHCSA